MAIGSWIRDRWTSYKAWRAKRSELPPYIATIKGDEIHIQSPDGNKEFIDLAYLRNVLVATNDSGPWGYDVWFVLEGSKNKIEFPLETHGLDDVLKLLEQLAGFQLQGMNSTDNAWFECWPNPPK